MTLIIEAIIFHIWPDCSNIRKVSVEFILVVQELPNSQNLNGHRSLTLTSHLLSIIIVIMTW